MIGAASRKAASNDGRWPGRMFRMATSRITAGISLLARVVRHGGGLEHECDGVRAALAILPFHDDPIHQQGIVGLKAEVKHLVQGAKRPRYLVQAIPRVPLPKNHRAAFKLGCHVSFLSSPSPYHTQPCPNVCARAPDRARSGLPSKRCTRPSRVRGSSHALKIPAATTPTTMIIPLNVASAARV